VGECFFWYRLTRVVPDKFHRDVKRLCVCVCWLVRTRVCIQTCICAHTHTHTHTHTNHFTALLILSGTTRVSQHQKGKTNLDLLEQEIVSGSGISWAICKSAP